MEYLADSLAATSPLRRCRAMPMPMTASRPEKPSAPLRECSSVTSRKEILRIIITLALSRMWILRKARASSRPQSAPAARPRAMDVGIRSRSKAEAVPPWAKPVKEVNSTITNTSSTDAPAIINWGMLSPVPYRSSISFSIFGTITAGDTAATTVPIIAASSRLIPRIRGASASIPRISKEAGTKHISTAALPTFFKSSTSRFRPALVRMMISAICLRSAEMDRMEPSSRLSAYGPSKIPVSSIPRSCGRFNRLKIAPIPIPHKKITARLNNISSLLSAGQQKKPMSLRSKSSQKSSAHNLPYKRFWLAPRENLIPFALTV